MIDLLRQEAIPPEKFIRNKLYRSLRDSGTSLVAVKYVDYKPVWGGWVIPHIERDYCGNTPLAYVFENLITNGFEYYKLENPPAQLTLVACEPKHPTCLAAGPNFILPYEETLREIALRKLPPVYNVFQPRYADEYTRGIIEAMIDGVRKKKKGEYAGAQIYDEYTREIMEKMKEERGGKWGGRRKSKRRVRSKKYRTRRR